MQTSQNTPYWFIQIYVVVHAHVAPEEPEDFSTTCGAAARVSDEYGQLLLLLLLLLFSPSYKQITKKLIGRKLTGLKGLWPFLSCTRTHTHTHAHTHTHTHTLSLSHTHTHSLSHTHVPTIRIANWSHFKKWQYISMYTIFFNMYPIITIIIIIITMIYSYTLYIYIYELCTTWYGDVSRAVFTHTHTRTRAHTHTHTHTRTRHPSFLNKKREQMGTARATDTGRDTATHRLTR